jgi:hypothetical protein
LADRLARHKQEQEAEQEVAASEFGSEADDPFAALGNEEERDPFLLDEEEQDITTFGKRKAERSNHDFSVSRGLTSLFAPHRESSHDDFNGSLDDSSSDTGSDADPEHPPLEARTSFERRPLEVFEDEEMGEMVAPTEEGNSSDEEVLSATEKKKLGGAFGMSDPDEQASEFAGQDDQDDDDDGDQLVEIAMPTSSKRKSRG